MQRPTAIGSACRFALENSNAHSPILNAHAEKMGVFKKIAVFTIANQRWLLRHQQLLGQIQKRPSLPPLWAFICKPN